MKINTRVFGEVELADDKVIHFVDGIAGFPALRAFTLLYDKEDGAESNVRWLQSLDEPGFSLPVVEAYLVKPDYAFRLDDDLAAKTLGDLTDENAVVFVTMTAPEDIKNLSVNLKSPIVVNADERKGCQVVLDDDHPVKYKVHDLLKGK